jgi:hypothetical protein
VTSPLWLLCCRPHHHLVYEDIELSEAVRQVRNELASKPPAFSAALSSTSSVHSQPASSTGALPNIDFGALAQIMSQIQQPATVSRASTLSAPASENQMYQANPQSANVPQLLQMLQGGSGQPAYYNQAVTSATQSTPWSSVSSYPTSTEASNQPNISALLSTLCASSATTGLDLPTPQSGYSAMPCSSAPESYSGLQLNSYNNTGLTKKDAGYAVPPSPLSSSSGGPYSSSTNNLANPSQVTDILSQLQGLSDFNTMAAVPSSTSSSKTASASATSASSSQSIQYPYNF